MKNLLGYLKKILLLFSLVFLFSLFNTQKISAQQLDVQSSFQHYWDGDTVYTTILLTFQTNDSPVVITYYTVTIPDTEISPEILSFSRNKELEFTIHKKEYSTDLVIDLEETPVYTDKPAVIKITFSKKLSGNTISLLSQIKNTQTKEFSLTYPSSLGNISWCSATILEIKSVENKIKITTEIPITEYVKVTFGENIIYSYVIKKNLLNAGDKMIIADIPLPVNNSFQHITVNNITPQPDKAYKDLDGNYLLQYSIAPLSSIDVEIQGYIFMNHSQYPEQLEPKFEKTQLWEINNISLINHVNKYIQSCGLNIPDTFSDINSLETSEEKELLYEAIYKYVIENLKPNISSAGSLMGGERLGGQQILLNQDIATDEDYADAIVSLYRYYNIPARFVIGYLSNISNYDSNGIFHFWAEYYNSEQNDWIIVEPFLEDYTKTPLWKKEMKDHVALIYRSSNPYTPKLPFYVEGELTIEPVKENTNYKSNFDIELILKPYRLTDPFLLGYISLTNTGTTVIDKLEIVNSKPDLSKYIDYIENNSSIIILPSQTYDIKFNIPAEHIPDEIFVSMNAFAGTDKIEGVQTKKEMEVIKSYSDLDILSKLIPILIYFLLSLSVYFILKKVKYKKVKRNG